MPSDDVRRPVVRAPPPTAGCLGVPDSLGELPRFRPRWPWIGADLQTLRDVLVGGPDPLNPAGSETLIFAMPDGTGDRLTGVLEQPHTPSPGRPLAILIHGLTGCADSRYVRRAAGRLQDVGHRTLRLNLRGAGACRPLCREQYHSGRSQDLDAVLAQLPADLCDEGLTLVGWSLGANLLLKGLAEFGAAYPIRAAVAVSAPVDLAAAAARLRSLRNWPYHRWLLARMKREAGAAPVPVPPGLAATLAAVRDIVDFDDRITAPRNGFAGAADYYARCSALGRLAAVPVPTLVIHALDDPWIPGGTYRDHDWDGNRNLVPVLPDRGGHVGFHAADGRVWSDDCMLGFLDLVSAGAAQPDLRRWATSTAK